MGKTHFGVLIEEQCGTSILSLVLLPSVLQLKRLKASLFSSVHSAHGEDIQLYHWLIEVKEFVDENVK